ncbi:MAG: metallophosphoesterase [Chitinophagales bacterium]
MDQLPPITPKNQIRKLPITKIFNIILLVGALLLGYTLVEPHWLRVKTIDYTSADVPVAFDGVRIAFLTDVHHGPFFSRNRVKKVVKKVNSLNPDLILLGGDYVSRDQKYIEPCFEELASLKAPLGEYGVLGNHDHWEGTELCRECMSKAGITCLDNQAIWLKRSTDKIKLGGVGDYWEDLSDLTPTTADVQPSDFVLAITHNPDFVETIQDSRVDLVLSGHNHDGQVTFFGLWAPVVPSAYGQKYRYGLVDTGVTKVYVSSGIGTITPPVRFCARPEIVIVQLNKK